MNYKAEHEQFVSNLKGSSAACVLTCLLHVPLFIFLTKLVQKGRKPRLLREFFFLSLPLLFTMTVFADYAYLSICIVLITAVSLYQTQRTRIIAESSSASESSVQSYLEEYQLQNHRTSYLTLSKGNI